MPVRSSFLILVLLGSASWAAELTTLKGDLVKGEVVGISDKEVVFTQDGARMNRALAEVLKINFRDAGKIADGTTYARVELTDGSVLNCSRWTIKRKDVELTLLAGPTVKVALAAVANVLAKSEVEANRSDWKERIAARRGKSALVIAKEGRPQTLPATLGEGDEKGETIQYAITLGKETISGQKKLDEVHGLIFKHVLDPKAPPVACKLLDTFQDVVMVSSVRLSDGNVVVSTPAGVSIAYKTETLVQLDYSKGRLDYLSDLEWLTKKVSSALESPENDQEHVYKDTNLGNPDPEKISVGGTTYNKGLTLRPYVELVYELKGEYRELSAMVGLDDRVPVAGGPVELLIEGDGRELQTLTFSNRDAKKFAEVKLNIKDVQRLRLVVRSRGAPEIDNTRHMALGDAKVSK